MFLLLILTVVRAWALVTGSNFLEMDAVTFFYPMYSYLGENLRSGDIPLWSPHQLAGAPFAADPQSGWMYLPAMVLFTTLPLVLAAKSFTIIHLLAAGVAMYLLARTLGFNVLGALLAGIVYEHNSYLLNRSVRCFACTEVYAWLPLTIMFAELAIRSPSRQRWVLYWGAGGLALSQILAAWLGQGAYYSLLALGGYVVYRTLISPPVPLRAMRARLGALAANGIGLLLAGFGLAAAGLLPRLEYNALSTLAGGYKHSEELAEFGGMSPTAWALLLNHSDMLLYAGGVTVVLAVVAPIAARRVLAVPFWSALTLGSLVLALPYRTPLHSLLYTLPAFERLHPHNPERIMILVYFGLALLAGATVSCLLKSERTGAFAALFPIAGILVLLAGGIRIPLAALLAVGAGVLFIAVCPLLGGYRQVAAALVMCAAFVDYSTAAAVPTAKMNLNEYYDPMDSGRYLQDAREAGPFRYFGYGAGVARPSRPYRLEYADPDVAPLLVNNRATVLGLEDIQGYNPVQVARYTEYMDTLNGRSQAYRQLQVLAGGADSPMLNLLNARYIVVPSEIAADRPDLQRLNAAHRTVFLGEQARVLENETALPRAWIVHDARQVRRGVALQLLATGAVDPRQTALLEEPPPPLGKPSLLADESAAVIRYQPENVQVRTNTGAPGLMILSEVYYPAWKAYVDGKPTKLYATDHVLRGIPVPAGAHTVELRYESTAMKVGLAISLLFHAGLGVVVLQVIHQRRQRPALDTPRGYPIP